LSTEQYLPVALLLLVCVAAVNDIATRRIPNRLLLAGLACAFLLHLGATNPGIGLLRAIEGMATGLAVFLPLYLLRGMAAGDVKMMAVVGAFAGPGATFEIAVLTWCAGGVMALLMVLLRRRSRVVLDNLRIMLFRGMTNRAGLATLAQQTSAGSMPYGVAIAAGTIVTLIRHYG
jgi:prepilin peptidase CpaA